MKNDDNGVTILMAEDDDGHALLVQERFESVGVKNPVIRFRDGQETWDFGDGSAPVTVRSDGCAEEKNKEGYARTQHVFQKPGDYIVRVERANERGEKATFHLFVPVK